jgi:uncharacterized membrane protein YcaP (DUF421 family)
MKRTHWEVQMLGIFVRTLVVYLLLTGAMRLMGKRQIGELEVSELITTLLISEIATLPIENADIPVLHAVIPIVTLVTLEVVMATVLSRSPTLRKRLESPPSMLVCRGEIDQSELLRNRMSVEELFSGLRQQGIADPSEVAYAIMEKNGQLSVILKAEHRPLTAGDVKSEVRENGMTHMLISDGRVNEYNLRLLGHDGAWLDKQLKKRGVRAEELLYLLCDDAGRISLLRKEGRA